MMTAKVLQGFLKHCSPETPIRILHWEEQSEVLYEVCACRLDLSPTGDLSTLQLVSGDATTQTQLSLL
jgi:hypothetical protein